MQYTSYRVYRAIAMRLLLRLLLPVAVALLAVLPMGLFAQGSITVSAPNGGESFIIGSTTEIRWSAPGVGGEVEVAYSTDGSQWRKIERVAASSGRFTWRIPHRESQTVQVRVAARDGSASDVSDGMFEIKPDPLDIPIMKSPNGGEIWTEGEKRLIQWQLPADAIGAKIELSTNAGLSWTTVAEVPALPAQYEWTVPHLADDDIVAAMMRVSLPDDAADFDESDAVFILKPIPTLLPSLSLLYPNGSERFVADTVIEIRWNAKNIPGKVELKYSTDGGGAWSGIGSADAAAGSMSWKVPNNGTAMGTIRVVALGGTIADIANGMFTVVEKSSGGPDTTGGKEPDPDKDPDDNDPDDIEPEIATAVSSPNGGEQWTEGERRLIRWLAPADVATVRVELSTDDGASWVMVASVPATPSEYEWTVPDPGDSVIRTARIRVTDILEEKHADVSDAPFVIAPKSGASSSVPVSGAVSGDLVTLGSYPNPSRETTELRWIQPRTAEVSLRLHDAAGDLVAVVQGGVRQAGEQRMDLRVAGLAGGVYMYELRSGASVARGTIVVAR